MIEFYLKQAPDRQQEYLDYLHKLGALSKLFSDSNIPYLYYRIHENLFCKVFDANNLSRGDISYDAKVDNAGVGLKTFLHNNGATLQKVAEFDSEGHILRTLHKDAGALETVKEVARLRNKRLDFAKNSTSCDEQLYHLITRAENKMMIFEYPMDYIDVDKIVIVEEKDNSIHFTDGIQKYGFSISKSTLYEKFVLGNPLATANINIVDDPFELIKTIALPEGITPTLSEERTYSDGIIEQSSDSDYIYLPLYSFKDGTVPEKSQLNQWNAGGRERDPDEVYISIPAAIHKLCVGFFPYTFDPNTNGSAKDSPKFKVHLPDGKILECKVAQAGGKALMSDPNKDLGKWILRQVLKLPYGKLLTKEYLDEIGIDSVRLSKISNEEYILDFAKSKSFEKFITRKTIEANI